MNRLDYLSRGFTVFLFISIGICCSFASAEQTHADSGIQVRFPFGASYNYDDIAVKRVVDGDTVILESGERVRLIGIDTPEMHDSRKLYRDSARTHQDVKAIKAMGERAYRFTRQLVEGKRVSLEFDVERQDRYGRLLAYVYLKDGTFVNNEIIRQGYASVLTIPPNVKYAELFARSVEEARGNKCGLWAE